MPLNRRNAIRQFIVVGAGIVLLPGCLHQQTPASISLSNLKLTGEEEETLAELASTIIPTTSTAGAREVSAHLFALKMVNDCFSASDRNKWTNGFAQFQQRSKKILGKSFINASEAGQHSLVSSLESLKGPTGKDDLAFFYQASKKLIIQVYTSSQYFLTNVQPYELVPSRFKGCVPVKAMVRKIA